MISIRTLAAILAMILLAGGCFKMDVNLNMPEGGEGEDKSAPGQLPSGGWSDLLTGVTGQVTMGAEHGVVFYAFDTLAYPNQPVDLAARLQSASNLKGIEAATVGFYDGSDELVGLAKTNSSGYATITYKPPQRGDYEFAAKILSSGKSADRNIVHVTPAPLLVTAREDDTEFVVIDLDHTIVASSFFRVLTTGAKPMAGSLDVVKRIARKYSIIYLTHRPDLLTIKSKNWLRDQGYPRGPLLVSDLKQAFGDSGKFKTAKLSAVKKSFPNVKIGIGDKPSDAQAYVDNGMVAYLIPHYKDKPKDLRKTAQAIRKLRSRGRLNVVSDWRQIEAGIFSGKTYPPERLAWDLERHADRLDAEEKARKRDDDDDDDD